MLVLFHYRTIWINLGRIILHHTKNPAFESPSLLNYSLLKATIILSHRCKWYLLLMKMRTVFKIVGNWGYISNSKSLSDTALEQFLCRQRTAKFGGCFFSHCKLVFDFSIKYLPRQSVSPDVSNVQGFDSSIYFFCCLQITFDYSKYFVLLSIR